MENQDREFIKIKGEYYELDQEVDFKTACKILNRGKSAVYKYVLDDLPHIKDGQGKSAPLIFIVRDLLKYRDNKRIYIERSNVI